MANAVVYDKAKWHYDGDYPKGLPVENAFIHTGMFLGWLIDQDLYSDFFQEATEELLTAFKNREKTGAQVYQQWDGVLMDEMLNDEGNAFAQVYLDFETGQFLQDYDELLGLDLPSLYHVEDSWENYAKLQGRINSRYEQWKQQTSK